VEAREVGPAGIVEADDGPIEDDAGAVEVRTRDLELRVAGCRVSAVAVLNTDFAAFDKQEGADAGPYDLEDVSWGVERIPSEGGEHWLDGTREIARRGPGDTIAGVMSRRHDAPGAPPAAGSGRTCHRIERNRGLRSRPALNGACAQIPVRGTV